MKTAIFLDIDGTLITNHFIIPDSAKLAVRKARENGHLIFICTGRSKGQIFPEILEVGFDGIVGAAGGYVEVHQEVILHERVLKEDVKLIVDFFNKHGIDFNLASNNGIFTNKNSNKRLSSFFEQQLEFIDAEVKANMEKGLKLFNDMIIVTEDLIRDDINGISFFGSEIPLDQIRQEFASKFTVIPSTVSAFGDNSGEISLLGVNKATGIEKVINHFNIRKEDTFGFGDSWNDLEMLEYVQYGIAMGNAHDAVKRVANDVTDRHDENGIYNSFQKYGLI
ncbi:Cof-type HAD-IIB family hydrolase [Neobacillus vireti]|uniref:Cof-type HAD-IIB family hydrolase n=1 Tax=Neobacillus vireti TaxID=220686 RepID=UPI003000D42E